MWPHLSDSFVTDSTSNIQPLSTVEGLCACVFLCDWNVKWVILLGCHPMRQLNEPKTFTTNTFVLRLSPFYWRKAIKKLFTFKLVELPICGKVASK